jgi:hypothetical protein
MRTPTSGLLLSEFQNNASMVKNSQSEQVRKWAEHGQFLRFHDRLHWDEIAVELGILKENGEPDTGMTYKIVVDGYEPKKVETRTRLGLPPVCPECHQRLPRPPRVVKFDPVQMEAVIAFLREREKPTIRVYARGGKLVK